MKYGRVVNGEAVDVIDRNPAELFHPELAATFVELPDGVGNGWRLEEGEWIAPPPAPEPVTPDEPPAPETALRLLLTPAEFRNSFSAFEEVAIVDFAAGVGAPDSEDAQTKTIRRVVGVFFERLRDPHLQTVDLADPRNLAGLDLLVGAGILSAERRETIAKGLRA